MSLRAGRVGVAPDQVDEFGKIKSEATSGYTKQEADAKFETKTDVAAALAEKQSMQLSVPLKLLSGSALTVESALSGLNETKTNINTAICNDGVFLDQAFDIDDLNTTGVYFTNISQSSISNLPSGINYSGGMKIIVTSIDAIADRKMQLLFTRGTEMYIRTRQSSTQWNAWFKFGLSTV